MQTFTAKTFCVNKDKICEIEVIACLDYKVIPVFTIIGIPPTLAKDLKVKIKAIFKQLRIKFPAGRLTIEFKNNKIDYSRAKLGFVVFALVYAFKSNSLNAFDYFYGDFDLKNNLTADVLSTIFAIENPLKKIAAGRCDLKAFFKITPNNIFLFDDCRTFLDHKNGKDLVFRYQFARNFEKKNALKINQIEGQSYAKRAVQIAVAGWHNLMIWGETGRGKTLLAESLYELLPEPDFGESAKIIKQKYIYECIDYTTARPYFFADTNINKSKLFKGIVASNMGCVVLDELCEWDLSYIRKLKNVIEQKNNYEKPLFIGISNLCPCGKSTGDLNLALNEPNSFNYCTCLPSAKLRYLNKLSQSFLERFSMEINVSEYDSEQSHLSKGNLINLDIISSVSKIQKERFKNELFRFNNFIPHISLDLFCKFSGEAKKIIEDLSFRYNISKRKLHNLKRVCRTIADLESSEMVKDSHVFEAMLYFDFKKDS